MTDPVIPEGVVRADRYAPEPYKGPAPEADTAAIPTVTLPPGVIRSDRNAPKPPPRLSPEAGPTMPADTSFTDVAVGQGFMLRAGDEIQAAAAATADAATNLFQGKSPEWVETYDSVLKEKQAGLEKYQDENPWTFFLGEFGGSMANPLSLKGAKYASGASSVPRVAGRSALVGGGLGLGTGFAGGEDGAANRSLNAAIGGTGGMAVGGIAAPIMAGAIKVIEIATRAIPGAAKREAAMKVADSLRRDDITPEQAMVRIRQIGGQAVVADIGENLRKLAGAATRIPGRTRTAATKFLHRRQRKQHERLLHYSRQALGAEGKYHKQFADIAHARSTAAEPVYKKAYDANKSMMSQEISRILETPAGKTALREAARMMRNDRRFLGPLDPEMTAALREAVQLGKSKAVPGGVAAGLSLRTLDYVKRALDDKVNRLYKAGSNTEAQIIKDLRNGFRSALDKADTTVGADGAPGSYAAARGIWSGHSRALEMMEDGRKFMIGDAEVLETAVSKMTNSQKEFFREGVYRHLAGLVRGKKEGVDKVAQLLRTPDVREKMASVIDDPSKYIGWARRLLGEEKMNKTLRELGGSPTGERLEEAANLTGNKSSLLRDLLWGAKGNVFAQQRLFMHAARGTARQPPPREAVADELAPLISNKLDDAMDLLRASVDMRTPSMMRTGLPPLVATGAAQQMSGPDAQELALLGPILLAELLETSQFLAER